MELASITGGRTGLAITGGKLHGASGRGQERGIVTAQRVAGETWVDTVESRGRIRDSFRKRQIWGRGTVNFASWVVRSIKGA